MKKILLFLFLSLIPLNTSLCYAVSSISISPAGDGVFTLQGIGIENACAFEINIVYDTTTLTSPNLVAGSLISGAMTAVNPNTPGLVRFVAIRIAPVTGSGTIATLSFTRTGSSPGRILSLTAKLANATGSPLTAQVQIVNPSDSTTSTSASSQSSTSAQAQSTSSGAVTAGTTVIVAPPGMIAGPATQTDKQPSQETADTSTRTTDQKPPEPAPSAEVRTADRTADAAQTSGKTSQPHAVKIYSQESVLERFRNFKGPRTADAFIALFDQESLIGCRQEPGVAISDGASIIKIRFITPPGNLASSDIALIGARLISLTRDPDNSNTWIAGVVPYKGVLEATLAVSLGDLKMIYPLTVAPAIRAKSSKAGNVSKKAFEDYLNGKADSFDKNDLNVGDAQTYRKDYIITANYLHATRGTP